MSSHGWKTVQSKIVYENPWIKLTEDKVIRPDGKEGIYGYLDKQPGVIIIPFDGEHIYFITEYRYPIRATVLSLPMGGVPDNTSPIDQVKNELFQETGILSASCQELGRMMVAPGHETTYCDIFLATDLDISGLKTDNQEGDEAISEIHKFTISEVKELIKNKKINCSHTLSAIAMFLSSNAL